MTGLVLTADAVAALATGSTGARTAPAGRWFFGALIDLAAVVVDPLDAATARAAGVVLARTTGTAALRVDLGQAIVSARARGWPLLAADASLLLLLAPDVDVVGLP